MTIEPCNKLTLTISRDYIVAHMEKLNVPIFQDIVHLTHPPAPKSLVYTARFHYAPNMPAPPPCLPCASPCIFSLTLTLTSKNLATQRSRQTDSPLLRSGSRYEVSMHFLEQEATSLIHNVSDMLCAGIGMYGCCGGKRDGRENSK